VICHGLLSCLGSRNLFAKTLSDWRSQAGVTSQLTFIVRVSWCLFSLDQVLFLCFAGLCFEVLLSVLLFF